MIRNKVSLICSAVIFGICMSLYYPFPDNEMIDARTTFMSFPISNHNGYNLLAIMGSVLFIIAIILLVRGITKYHIRTVILALFVYTLLPLLLITIYQETLADGIGAISYDGKGFCDFQEVSENEVNGECQFFLHNHSDKSVSFELEFLDSYFGESDTRLTSLMNVNGPYRITMEGNSEKSIQLNELLNVSGVHDHITSGSSMDIHFQLIDRETTREM